MSRNSPYVIAGRPMESSGKRNRNHNDKDCYVDDDLVEKLQGKRNSVIRLMNDAEEKQFTDEQGDIKKWLVSIKHTMYDANDLLDKINTEKQFREKYKKDRSRDEGFVDWATSEIKRIIKKLKVMVEAAGVMGLKARDEGAAAAAQQTRIPNDRETSPVIGISTIVYGREEEKARILKQVLYSPKAAVPVNKPEVIAIVGMGGLGKTTLAKYVYNHADVKSCFTRSWACVSDNFDLVRVTQAILESFTRTAAGVCDLSPLQQQLKEQLTKKRFLVVLDDAWDYSWQNWEKLMAPFSTGAAGSKIILTTRDMRVAGVAPADHSFQLMPMSEDDAWSLFSCEVFRDGELSQHPKLEAIGKEIVEKCGGSPLAIKTLSGLLRSERKEVEWERVRESSLWQLPEDFHLQLNGHKAVKECKKVRHVSFHDHSECSMSHSSQSKSARKVLYQAESLQTFMVQYEPFAPRCGLDDKILEDVLLQQLSLRVLCLRGTRIRTLPDTISNLKQLRHLDVSYSDVEVLPAALCELYNLRRLLCESCDQIEEFHYDMAAFVSLRHFTLSGMQLQKAPQNLSQLSQVKLEFYLPYSEDDCMNQGDGTDSSEEGSVDAAIVDGVSRIRLSDSGDEEEGEVGVALDHAESDSNHTESGDRTLVHVDIDRSTFHLYTYGKDALIASDLLESLRPHRDVKEVRIQNFNGTEFPGWLVDRSYLNIEKVELSYCWISSGLMPALGGLPSLKHLQLEGAIGPVNYSTVPFGSLEELDFWNLEEWEEWELSDNAAAGGICFFPRLRILSIVRCPKLKGRLPSNLPSLKKLEIESCSSLVELNGCHRHRQVVDLQITKCGPRLANSCLVDMRLGMFPYLERLTIGDCDSFECFPADDSLPTSLTNLGIQGFTRLKKLDVFGLRSLINLEGLSVNGCPLLESLPYNSDVNDCSSDDEFPFNSTLRFLYVQNCENLKTINGAWLRSFTSLEYFYVDDCPEFLAPTEVGFPRSLTKLHLTDIKNIRRQDWIAIQNLTSLEELWIYSDKMKAVPVKLPCSLKELRVLWNRLDMIERCKRDTGPDWPNIAHVPKIW